MLKRLVGSSLNADHLVSGFRKCGIFPADRQQVLQELPGLQKDPGGPSTMMHISSSVITLLKDQVTQHRTNVKKRRGKKIIHGKRITPKDLSVDDTSADLSNECEHCRQPWDCKGDDRWIQCDRCDLWYHLQCSGVNNSIDDYNDLDIARIDFSCENCDFLEE